MKGFINEEALAEYVKLAAEKLDPEFSEGETYDFARCMRADGSFYGTRGNCKKGTAAGDAPAKEKGAKKKPAGNDTGKTQQLREAQATLFNDAKAKRAAAKEAEKNVRAVAKETKGDKSPEARKRRMEAARAWDKAGTAADRAQTAWMKAHEKWSRSVDRDERAKMTPEQKKEARRIDKIIRERG